MALSMVDAAYAILKEMGTPQHYRDITEIALQRALINSQGLTPEASLLSAINRENARRTQRGEIPRFDQLDDGVYGLVEWRPTGIEQQIREINKATRDKLRDYLLQMPAKAFEDLIGKLLQQIGFDEDTVRVTGRSGDGGIDVVGVMDIEGITRLDVAVQVKRVKANIPADRITALRGSLMPNQRGIFVTTSEFTKQAVQEASATGKTPISLVGGNQLLDLLFQHEIGVTSKEHRLYELNLDDMPEVPARTATIVSTATHKILKQIPVTYPLPILARASGQLFEATLLDSGEVIINGQTFSSVSAAGKHVTGWKSCNGWRFWIFVNPLDQQEYFVDTLRKG